MQDPGGWISSGHFIGSAAVTVFVKQVGLQWDWKVQAQRREFGNTAALLSTEDEAIAAALEDTRARLAY